nr:hypothetical protein [Streptococcus equi]
MASVFLLLLQAYLSHISQLHQEYQAQMDYAKAQLIAEMVYQEQPSGARRLLLINHFCY